MVEGGFYERDFSSGGFTYDVVFVRDEWVVKRTVRTWRDRPNSK